MVSVDAKWIRVNATFVQPDCGKADAIIVTMSITNMVLPKIAQERMKRMETRTARIGVIGLGYVGCHSLSSFPRQVSR